MENMKYRYVTPVTKCVAELPYCILSPNDVRERLRSCCGFVIQLLCDLLIDMQTKFNSIMLMLPIYVYVRKHGKNIR